MVKKSNFEKFKSSYNYGALLKEFSFQEEGIWKILGESDNCDYGGHHYQPELALVEGRLLDVIHYAVELPRFFTWGSGGNIVKLKPIIKINSGKIKELQEKKKLLSELELTQAEYQKKIDALKKEIQ